MKKRNLILTSVASVGLGLASASWAAPVMTSRILIFDPGPIVDPIADYAPGAVFADAPLAGPVVTLQPNKFYVVVIEGTLAGHNQTDADRTAAVLKNAPLGLQSSAARVLSTGTANAFSAVGDTSTDPASWVGVASDVPAALTTYNPVNLLPGQDADTDLDPVGAGILNTSLNLATSATVGTLRNFQVGLPTGLTGGPTVSTRYLSSGLFRTGATGNGTLVTAYSTLTAYKEGASGTSLAAESIVGTVVNEPTQWTIAGGVVSPVQVDGTPNFVPLNIAVQPTNAALGQYVSPIVPVGGSSISLNVDPTGPGGIEPNSDTIFLMLKLTGDFAGKLGDIQDVPGSIDFTVVDLNDTDLDFHYPGTNVVLKIQGPGILNGFRNIDIDFGAGVNIDQAAAVPEPATLGLLALGAVGLLSRRRRS